MTVYLIVGYTDTACYINPSDIVKILIGILEVEVSKMLSLFCISLLLLLIVILFFDMGRLWFSAVFIENYKR